MDVYHDRLRQRQGQLISRPLRLHQLNLNAGDVFTIGALGAGVHEVNAVTKARLPFLKQFRCVSYASNSLVLSPAFIWNGAFQNGESVGQTDLNRWPSLASVLQALSTRRT